MRLPFNDDDSPFSEWLRSGLRLVFGFVQIAAVLAWPWLSMAVLDVTVPKGKPGFMPMLLGTLFFAQIFVGMMILVMEIRLRFGFDPNDANDTVREAASFSRCQNATLAVSAVFFAFTAWFNSYYLTRAGIVEMLRDCGALAFGMWLFFVVVPPVFWFALNVWRWRNAVKLRR